MALLHRVRGKASCKSMHYGQRSELVHNLRVIVDCLSMFYKHCGCGSHLTVLDIAMRLCLLPPLLPVAAER